MSKIDQILNGDNIEDVVNEIGKRGGPGGMKCTKCDFQGSCDDLKDGKCPECGAEVKQVGQGNPPASEASKVKAEDIYDAVQNMLRDEMNIDIEELAPGGEIALVQFGDKLVKLMKDK